MHFKNLYSFILHVWAFSLHVCMDTTCVPSIHGDQKWKSNILEVGLRTVLSHNLGNGSRISISSGITKGS